MTGAISGQRSTRRLPIVMLIGFFIVLALFGGASRADVPSQIVVRLFALGLASVSLLQTSADDRRIVAMPLTMLAVLAAIMVAQLVPLPPVLWTALPGRDLFAQLAELAGMPQPWRPLSITPDLTINSLLSLSVPAAALLIIPWLPRGSWEKLMIAMLILSAASAILGLAQITGGMSALYFYEITNRGVAVGLFANRNHQALLLALNLPILLTFVMLPIGEASSSLRKWVAVIWALFLLPLVLVTGSRAGLALYMLALVLSWLLYLRLRVKKSAGISSGHSRTVRGKLIRLAAARPELLVTAGLILMGALTLIMSRGEAVRRLSEQSASDDLRLNIVAPALGLAWKYFPMGAGFGAFPDVYRVDEPMELLSPEYVNHAHNDLLEFAVDGGLPASILLVVFFAWFVIRSRRAWSGDNRLSSRHALPRLGSVIVLLMLVASVLDYPLRTPIMMAMFAFGCGLLCVESRSIPSARRHENGPF